MKFQHAICTSPDIMLWKVFKLRECVYLYVDTISGALQLSPILKPIVQRNPCVTLCLHLLHQILLEQVRFDLKAPWMPSSNVPSPQWATMEAVQCRSSATYAASYTFFDRTAWNYDQMCMLFSHGPVQSSATWNRVTNHFGVARVCCVWPRLGIISNL